MEQPIDIKLKQIADRIRELRIVTGLSVAEMAERTGISESEYEACENGTRNLSIAFLYHCVLIFGVDMSDILEGKSPKLRSYALTRRGEGQKIEQLAEDQIGLVNAVKGLTDAQFAEISMIENVDKIFDLNFNVFGVLDLSQNPALDTLSWLWVIPSSLRRL